MLTPTDIHYLIGLLTRASDGNDVEIELGDMVYDEAGEKERDLDVTVKRRGTEENVETYRGIEVKRHTQPLDIIHIEQLCLKMKDMPVLTHKSIVSASGYTKSAILKAQKHGVELLEIVEWGDTMEGFDNIRTEREKWIFKDEVFEWGTDANTRFITENPHQADVLANELVKGHPAICKSDRTLFPSILNMRDLAANLSKNALNIWATSEDGNKMQANSSVCVEMTLDLPDKPNALVEDELVPFSKVQITGTVIKTETTRKGEFKVLRKVGENKPICCCVIYETRGGHLSGMSMSNTDNMCRALVIPYQDRIRSRIYKQKLPS